MAAQFTLTKLRAPRGLISWMARAISSLPVPVSPSTITVASVGATICAVFSSAWKAGLSPIMLVRFWSRRISSSR